MLSDNRVGLLLSSPDHEHFCAEPGHCVRITALSEMYCLNGRSSLFVESHKVHLLVYRFGI